MDRKSVSVRIIPSGMAVSPRSKDFSLQQYSLKDIVLFTEGLQEQFDVRVYVDGVELKNAVMGMNSKEKMKNLPVFLKNLSQNKDFPIEGPEVFEILKR